MLDEFDQYSRQGERSTGTYLKSFTPKFDVKEVKDAYELHGELPGIEQKDVDIEFTDAHTLTVKGHTESSYTSGTPPTGFVEDSPAQGAITDGEKSHKAHKATVEDEGAEGSTVVAKRDETPQQQRKEDVKYWVSERSVGHFSRSFTFPTRVDQDNVKASMKNGILTIHVPKIKKQEARKITIS
jgi:HSP20 family protein